MTQMDIFYHAMNYTSKGTMDISSRGAFRIKSVEESTQLIEELSKSYKAPSEASGSGIRLRAGGVIELNKMSTIEAKLDAIMNRMKNQERRGHSCNEVGIVEGAEQKNIADFSLDDSLSRQGKFCHDLETPSQDQTCRNTTSCRDCLGRNTENLYHDIVTTGNR